jgi:hypothetical protein
MKGRTKETKNKRVKGEGIKIIQKITSKEQ